MQQKHEAFYEVYYWGLGTTSNIGIIKKQWLMSRKFYAGWEAIVEFDRLRHLGFKAKVVLITHNHKIIRRGGK